jgi:hypothetical protein
MPRWTEEQIEAWLVSETRDLTMLDGTQRPMTMTKLHWSAVDTLAVVGPYTQEELIRYAQEEVELQGVDFDLAFRSVVAFLDNATTERWKLHDPFGSNSSSL